MIQHAKGMLDYSASELCIMNIARRGELRAVNRVKARILNGPDIKPNTGRRVPPHRSGSGFNGTQTITWPYPPIR